MSTKLDTIAYRKMPMVERRLYRLEKIVMTLEQIERGCHIFPDKRQEYFDLLNEIATEIHNAKSNSLGPK